MHSNNGLTIKFLTYSFNDADEYQEQIVNDFNNYAKEQNLDITIHKTTLTTLNSSDHVDNYEAFVEAKLKKKSQDYDIFLIDNIYSNRFAEDVNDLSKYLSNEIIDKYTNINLKTGYVGEKLITLVSF